MSEIDDVRQARLFDALLSEAERWRTPASAQARRVEESDAAVAADLALVATLRETQPSRDETAFARARVAQQLAELMRAEPTPASEAASEAISESAATVAPSHIVRVWPRVITASPTAGAAPDADSQRLRRLWRLSAWPERERVGATLRRLALLVAALLLVATASLAGASAASAQALPESPFYAVKRLEETTLLALSWSDESKGQTLTMIANHRLIEAAAEAGQQRTDEARSLLHEFDSTFAQLIDLAADAKARHENTSVLARAIQTTLAAEQTAATQANAHNETAFAQAADASAQAATTHIASAGVGLPTTPSQGAGQSNGQGVGNGNGQGAGQSNGHGNGQGSGNSSGNGQGKPQQTPGAQPTHTPHPDHGNGSGNGKKSDLTPTPATEPTATPTVSG
jgi:hypothetical protein